MTGTSISDHGQECLSRSRSAPSLRARSAMGPTGGTPVSNGVLWPRTNTAPSVWLLPPVRKISYSVLIG